MDTPTMFLCTSLLAMVVSSVAALSPLAQNMNAEIMSDFMDLQRKIMKYKLIQSTFGGQKGGNSMFPPALQNMFASVGGMVPSEMSSVQTMVNTGTQTGSIMPDVAPTLQNMGLKNPKPAAKTTNAKKPSKNNSVKSKSGKVTSLNNAAKTPMTSSSKQTPVVDMLGNVPTAIGSTLEQNPMLGLEMAALMNAGSMMNTAGGSMLDQGQVPSQSNTGLGASSSVMNNGQAGMANLGRLLIQQDLCSETPSKLRNMCTTSKDCSHNMQCVCSHNMQCFTRRCCANNLVHAEMLDNMLERLERQRAHQAWMKL